jgi:hypothetical protein
MLRLFNDSFAADYGSPPFSDYPGELATAGATLLGRLATVLAGQGRCDNGNARPVGTPSYHAGVIEDMLGILVNGMLDTQTAESDNGYQSCHRHPRYREGTREAD